MPLIKNGQAISAVSINGRMITDRLYKNGQMITLGGGAAGNTYNFSDANVQFSVSITGVVSLSASATITASTYSNGQELGVSPVDIIRTNRVTITVPSGFDNTGDSLTQNVTATQQGANRPSVITREPTSVRTTSVRLQGSITDNGSIPILESGFYIIPGTGYSSSQVASNGDYVFNSVSDIIGDFNQITSGLQQNTTYSFIAFARNAIGTTYSPVRTFTTDEAAAVAGYLMTRTGEPTGGTVTSMSEGPWSDWSGAADIVLDGSGVPQSASCESDQALCTITRTRTVTDTYTGGTREDDFTCSITQPGSGNPRCSDPDNLVGAVIQRDVTGVTYTEQRTEIQTRMVTNDAEDNRVEFTAGNIQATCTITAAGVAAVRTNFGETTVTSTHAPNNTGTTRTVTVTYNVVVRVAELNPNVWLVEETGDLTFRGLTVQCMQPPVPLQQPAFTANSARVTAIGVNTSVADGGIVFIQGTGGTYQVTAPTGVGGIVTTLRGGNGAGSFTLGGGRSRDHSFRITNALGTASYIFTVEASI